jgi:hypothetical protein
MELIQCRVSKEEENEFRRVVAGGKEDSCHVTKQRNFKGPLLLCGESVRILVIS